MPYLILISFLCLSLVSAQGNPDSFAPDYRQYKKRAFDSTINYFESLFWTQYAPIRWKQLHFKWDPRREGELVKQNFSAATSFDESKKSFNRYLGSCRDIHVGVYYDDVSAAYIPINVDWVDNKIIVVGSRLYGIQRGDEIVTINNQPALEYFSQQIYGSPTNLAPINRLSFHIWRLFFRLGFKDAMPDFNELVITVKRPNQSLQQVEAKWNYVANIFRQYSANRATNHNVDSFDLKSMDDANEYSVATFKSYYNQYKELISSRNFSDEDLRQLKHELAHDLQTTRAVHGSTGPFWNIHRVNKKRIGYLSIPDFTDKELIPVTLEAVNAMNIRTDALLIDLRDNGGGYQNKCFGVLSMLSQEPLANLIESEILDEKIINIYKHLLHETHTLIDRIENGYLPYFVWDYILRDIDIDYPWTRERLHGFHNYLLSAVEEWNAGHTCTRFMPIEGESFITPHESTHYYKPIFVLMNENTASCGDLFPAILKDNNRAILIGSTTTGAGGAVRWYSMPNFTGIQVFSLTRSLAMRNHQQVLEDLGVSPDYAYKRTLEDIINPELELKRALEFTAQKLHEIAK